MSRHSFDATTAKYSENVLDVLQTAGVQIWWCENDDRSKGICSQMPNETIINTKHAEKYRDDNSCLDAVLLDELSDYLQTVQQDTLIVLHMIGSHGLAYYKRYPEEFKVFAPSCDTV